MSRTGSWVTYKFRSVLDVVHATRFQSSYGRPTRNSPTLSAAKLGRGFRMHPGLQFSAQNTNSNTSTCANEVQNVKVQPPAPASPSFTFPNWLRWILGSVLSLLLPFWKDNWEKLQRIEGEAELVVEGVEKVANVVEKVATAAENVSEEVAEKLPEDGKLKKAALLVESVSKKAVHDAQLTEEFIHKVEQLKNHLDDLESFVEPVVDKILKKAERK